MLAVKNAVPGRNVLFARISSSTWESIGFMVFWIVKVGNGESFRVMMIANEKMPPIIHMIWCTMVIGNNRFILEYLKG